MKLEVSLVESLLEIVKELAAEHLREDTYGQEKKPGRHGTSGGRGVKRRRREPHSEGADGAGGSVPRCAAQPGSRSLRRGAWGSAAIVNRVSDAALKRML